MTPDDRIAALVALCHQLLDDYHADPRGPYTLTASITRGQFTERMRRLAELEREEPT